MPKLVLITQEVTGWWEDTGVASSMKTERLFEFCTTNNLVTLFPHWEIHKITWCCPNGRDINQIDHLMINGKWRSSLRDVKVRRGEDIGNDRSRDSRPKIEIKGCRASSQGVQPFLMWLNWNIRMCENLLSLRCATDLRLMDSKSQQLKERLVSGSEQGGEMSSKSRKTEVHGELRKQQHAMYKEQYVRLPRS